MKIQGAIGSYNTIRDSFYNFAQSNHTVRLMARQKNSTEIVHLGDHRKKANYRLHMTLKKKSFLGRF